MGEAEVLCDRIAVMDHAHIVALDTTENLLKLPGLDSSVRFRVDRDLATDYLQKVPSVTQVEHEDHTFRLITTNPEMTLSALFRLAREDGFRLIDLQLHQPTLEDVFLKLTGHALRD